MDFIEYSRVGQNTLIYKIYEIYKFLLSYDFKKYKQRFNNYLLEFEHENKIKKY